MYYVWESRDTSGDVCMRQMTFQGVEKGQEMDIYVLAVIFMAILGVVLYAIDVLVALFTAWDRTSEGLVIFVALAYNSLVCTPEMKFLQLVIFHSSRGS